MKSEDTVFDQLNVQRAALTGSITSHVNTAVVDNPKARAAVKKVPLSLCPASVRIAIARVFQIGGTKPGRWHFNWRDEPVTLRQYLDAPYRHLAAWEDGEEWDEDMTRLLCQECGYEFVDMESCPEEFKVSHLHAALSSLAILVDAQETGNGKLIDDRPKVKGGAAKMLKRFMVKKSTT